MIRNHIILIISILITGSLLSCNKKDDSPHSEYVSYSIQDISDYANGNVLFIRNYLSDYLSDNFVNGYSTKYEHGSSETINVEFSNGKKASFNNLDDTIRLPRAEIIFKGGKYMWHLPSFKGRQDVSIDDDNLYPRYRYSDGSLSRRAYR